MRQDDKLTEVMPKRPQLWFDDPLFVPKRKKRLPPAPCGVNSASMIMWQKQFPISSVDWLHDGKTERTE